MALESETIKGNSIVLQNHAADLMQSGADLHAYDAIFPIFAFVMVIVVPSIIAMWVIYKTLREKECGEDEL